MRTLKQAIPWWLRIGVKLVLSRLPLQYSFWKKLRLFEHGDMHKPTRALDTFLEHAHTAGILDVQDNIPRLISKYDKYTVLELGPGDSLFTAIIAKSLGASRTWLLDVGPFATTEMKAYSAFAACLRQRGLATHFVKDSQKIEEILRSCDCDYLTDGLRSLSQLPSNSVDYCFSNAVLEHISNDEFTLFAAELYRVVKSGGVSVHRVDLKDHLGGALNNLRFSNAIWEGAIFRNSGFYTNRIRFKEMIAIFESVGFNCNVTRVLRWGKLPTNRKWMSEQFRHLLDDDLFVYGFDVVLRREG